MPHKKKSMASLVWDINSKAGQALIKAVNDGEIDEDVPPNLMCKSRKMWKDYNATPFRCALHRAIAAKKRVDGADG